MNLKKLLLYTIPALIIGFLAFGIASADNPNYWLISGSYLKPLFSTYGLQLPTLLNKSCLGTDASGHVQTGTCSGGGGSSATTTINGLSAINYTFVATTTQASSYGIATTAPGTVLFNIPISSASNTGQLQSADWSTFNNKLGAYNVISANGLISVATTTSLATLTASTSPTFTNGAFTGTLSVAGVSSLATTTVTTRVAGDSTTNAANTLFVTTAVNNAIAGVNPAVAVQAATTQGSDTSGLTYNNGVSGVGATFTGSNNTAIVIDGYTFTALGQRLLVKNDTQSPSGADNGIYYVTQVQTAILPPILTRALDYDMPSDINNTGAIPVVNGTANAATSWLLTSTVSNVGVDPLTYTKFSINPATIVTSVSGAGSILSSGGQTPTLQLQNLTTNDVLFGQGNSTIATSSNFTFTTGTNNLFVTNSSSTNSSIATNLYLSNIASGNCLQTGAGGLVTSTGSACGAGGGGGSISTSTTALIGHNANWTGLATLGNGALLDNGTVLGFNATSSTIDFNLQGTSGSSNDLFNIASSSVASVFKVDTNGFQTIQPTATGTIYTLNNAAGQNLLTINSTSIAAAPATNILQVASSSGATVFYVNGYGNASTTGSMFASAFITGGAPTIATSTGSGSAGTASITGGNSGGEITINALTSPVLSATIATITPSISAPNNWYCTITPSNAAAQALAIAAYPRVGHAASTWSIISGTTALSTSVTYLWQYTCIAN